ncbi:MAG: S-adenosylmethionine decarboxylase [Candidatus Liptonbacteria bacterium]|nr:S-adenosylmethionine decarboxylase [Candidatus Liptonbacteria bacterium]
MKNIAPEIFRKRVLVDARYGILVSEQTVREYLIELPSALDLRVYGDPIVHSTSGQGKLENQGYDGFAPLIDSGIYIGVWSGKKFLSSVIYTCKDFSTEKAIEFIKNFFKTSEIEFKEF